MLNCLEWTSGLSAGRGCVFPFLGWIALTAGKRKMSVQKNHTLLFFSSTFPIVHVFLSSPSLPLRPFICLSWHLICPLSLSLLTKLRYMLFPILCLPVLLLPQAQNLLPTVATPLVCLSLSCSQNPFPPHPWCLIPVGSQNIGCSGCLFQGKQAPLLKYFLKI